MGDNDSFGFGKFVPGFDFLQNLAKGASQTLPQMPTCPTGSRRHSTSRNWKSASAS